MRTRTPAFDREQNDFSEQFFRWWAKSTNSSPEAVAQGFREYEHASGENMVDVDPRDVFEMIRDDRYEIEKPRQNNVKMMLSLALDIAQALLPLQWIVLWAPKDAGFVASDNPFVVVPPPGFDDRLEGCGILTPGATTLVPLSQKTCLFFRAADGGDIRYGVARGDFVRHVNCLVAANSERFVIARQEELLRKIVKRTHVGEWRRGPTFQMNVPDPYGHVENKSGESNPV